MKFKVRNSRGEIVEIDLGSEMREAMKKHGGEDAVKLDNSLAFRAYLSEKDVKLKDVIRAIGISDLGATSVRALLTNDGQAPLFNAVVEDGLRMGFERGSNWQRLLARTVNADQFKAEWIYLEDEDLDNQTELRDIGQGAPIPVATLTVGDQSIKMHKRGRGIEWTDESRRANIDLVALWLQRLGTKLGRSYEDIAVNRLLNGYFPDGSDAPPTIGVGTAGTLTPADMFYASQYQQQMLGFTPNIALMNLATATDWVGTRDNGALFFRDNIANGTFPDVVNAAPFISEQMPDGMVMMLDSRFGLIRYQGKAFGVESDRNVKTQVSGTYGTEISEFVPFEPNARLLVDIGTAR